MRLDDIPSFGNLELLAKHLVDGFITGKHQSPYHGFSVEFAEHRNYNSGESMRHIDWKVYAKTDKLMVKTYDEETNLKAYVGLDVSSSMFYPKKDNKSKLAFSILSIAALFHLMQRQRDAFSLHTFAAEILSSSPIKSTRIHLHTLQQQMQTLLEASQPIHQSGNLASVCHVLAEKAGKRSMVILFTDLLGEQDRLEEFYAALQHLKHNKHDVLLFHVLDTAQEVDLAWEQRPYWVEDAESGAKIKVYPQAIQKEYQSKITQYLQNIYLRCGEMGVELVVADINQDIEQVLTPFLLRRSLLY